jgi:hypothetical protein
MIQRRAEDAGIKTKIKLSPLPFGIAFHILTFSQYFPTGAFLLGAFKPTAPLTP